MTSEATVALFKSLINRIKRDGEKVCCFVALAKLRVSGSQNNIGIKSCNALSTWYYVTTSVAAGITCAENPKACIDIYKGDLATSHRPLKPHNHRGY